MGCTSSTALVGIPYACSDIPIGGLKQVWFAHKDSIVTATETAGEVTAMTFTTTGLTKQLEFNNKDGFSAMTNVKTVSADNIINAVPTVVIEFPKMTTAKRLELDAITNAGYELVVFVEDASGMYHMLGYEYGMYASEVNGQTGTGRASKNVFQLTLVGEEDSLGLTMSSDGWADMIASTAA